MLLGTNKEEFVERGCPVVEVVPVHVLPRSGKEEFCPLSRSLCSFWLPGITLFLIQVQRVPKEASSRYISFSLLNT